MTRSRGEGHAARPENTTRPTAPPERLQLHGVRVPTADFLPLKQLSEIVFGLFDVRSPDAFARRESVKIAVTLLDSARIHVETIERRLSAPQAQRPKGTRCRDCGAPR